MGDARDDDEALRVVDGVHDSLVTNTDPEVISTGELGHAARSRVVGQAVDRCPDTLARGAVKASERTRGDRVEANLVGALGRPLLPDGFPGHRELDLVPRLESGEAVLEVFQAVEKLCVAIDVDEDARKLAALRDVQRVVALAERVKLPAKPGTEVFGSDDSGHGLTVRLTVRLIVRQGAAQVNGSPRARNRAPRLARARAPARSRSRRSRRSR